MILILMLCFSKEGIVSQVMQMPEDMLPTFNEMVKNSDHIVELKYLDKQKEYYRKTFPKDTHHARATESVYIENVNSYKVIKVLKSKTLKVGDDIWLYRVPAYGEQSAQNEHEYAMLESPYFSQYRSKYPNKNIEMNSFFFLKNLQKPKTIDTYLNIENGSEGLGAEIQIKKAMGES